MEEELIEKVRKLGFNGFNKKGPAKFSQLKDEDWMSLFAYMIQVYEQSLSMDSKANFAAAQKQFIRNLRVLDLAHKVANVDPLKQKGKLLACLSGIIDKLEYKYGEAVYNPSGRPRVALLRFNFEADKENESIQPYSASAPVAASASSSVPASIEPSKPSSRASVGARRVSSAATSAAPAAPIAAAAPVLPVPVPVRAKPAPKPSAPRPRPSMSMDPESNIISSGRQLARTPPRSLMKLPPCDEEDLRAEEEHQEEQLAASSVSSSLVQQSFVHPSSQYPKSPQTRSMTRKSLAAVNAAAKMDLSSAMEAESTAADASRSSSTQKDEAVIEDAVLAAPKPVNKSSRARPSSAATAVSAVPTDVVEEPMPMMEAPFGRQSKLARTPVRRPDGLVPLTELTEARAAPAAPASTRAAQNFNSSEAFENALSSSTHPTTDDSAPVRRVSKATQQRLASKSAKAAAQHADDSVDGEMHESDLSASTGPAAEAEPAPVAQRRVSKAAIGSTSTNVKTAGNLSSRSASATSSAPLPLHVEEAEDMQVEITARASKTTMSKRASLAGGKSTTSSSGKAPAAAKPAVQPELSAVAPTASATAIATGLPMNVAPAGGMVGHPAAAMMSMYPYGFNAFGGPMMPHMVPMMGMPTALNSASSPRASATMPTAAPGVGGLAAMWPQLPLPLQLHLQSVDQQLQMNGFDTAQRETHLTMMMHSLLPFYMSAPAAATAQLNTAAAVAIPAPSAAQLSPPAAVSAPLPAASVAAPAVHAQPLVQTAATVADTSPTVPIAQPVKDQPVPVAQPIVVEDKPQVEQKKADDVEAASSSKLKAPQPVAQLLRSPAVLPTSHPATAASTAVAVSSTVSAPTVVPAPVAPVAERVSAAAVVEAPRTPVRAKPSLYAQAAATRMSVSKLPSRQPVMRTPVATSAAAVAVAPASSTSPLWNMQAMVEALPVTNAPASSPQLPMQAAAASTWGALANIRNMEAQAKQLASSQQLLQQRDVQIASQLERMDADLSIMVTAFQDSGISDYKAQCAQLREKIAALVNRRKSSEHIADEEINAIQHELFVQFEQWRNQTDAGKLLIQHSLEEMGRRFKELRAHLELQAQQRQREIDAIRKYNKRLQSGLNAVKSPARSARVFELREPEQSNSESKQNLRRVQQFLDQFKTVGK